MKDIKFAVELESVPFERVHSDSWRINFRSIKSFISIKYVGSNIFWWIDDVIATHNIW